MAANDQRAAPGFPTAVANLTWSLGIRETNLTAEKKLLAQHVEKRDQAQALVDQFQRSVDEIEAEVSQMRDELARLSAVTK